MNRVTQSAATIPPTEERRNAFEHILNNLLRDGNLVYMSSPVFCESSFPCL